jgi:hypothetical protein
MKVCDLLVTNAQWVKGAPAIYRNSKDKMEPTDYVHHRDAEAWCLGGAIDKCYPDANGPPHITPWQHHSVHHQVWKRVLDWLPEPQPIAYEDGYTYVPKKRICDWNDDPRRRFEEVRRLVEELDI